jgi:DNA topoisomerase-1
MAKKTRSRKTTRKAAPDTTGKQLVIVESPSKARTINRYLGDDYVVLASVGHIRDLPTKSPKGDKSPVPGIDLEHEFRPTYEILDGKKKTVAELKKAAKQARRVWFATDLDREGEAIAWHLAQELGIPADEAQRVIFSAITRTEIERAFAHPHPLNMDRVNAQQARRILDRIVGYQVSPLLWKKVARGLSAGRVQSVAVRLVVEREREIRAFVPDEYWDLMACFHLDAGRVAELEEGWHELRARRDEKGKPLPRKELNAWLAQERGLRAQLVEVDGEKFELKANGSPENPDAEPTDLSGDVQEIARLAGLTAIEVAEREDPKGKGPARILREIGGRVADGVSYRVKSIETKRTNTRPSAPFITSTLQQAASSRLGFAARRTMRTAQSLYEGVVVPGEGPVGLITYMRTDSTHLAGEALNMARDFIEKNYGEDYLPAKPNFFGSSNKQAQEAHEAIRPTTLRLSPQKVKKALSSDQFKLYSLIWERFVACQMTPAQWDSTTVLLEGGTDPQRPVVFKTNGRVLVFDGHYRVSGVPTSSDEQTLPPLAEQTPIHPFAIEPRQRFTAPPARYSEASLIKTLEARGIGRPSTYASIIQVIQDRKYVENIQRRFFATHLGEKVTDKLTEAFPKIMDVDYTRQMESDLDQIEEDHLDWVEMLADFYGPFKERLDEAHENMVHAKAETEPAPKEYRCGECGADTVYRFGKNGSFLSCSRYPECRWASPIDREGRPQAAEIVDVACYKCGAPMLKRTGRFGPFLGCTRYGDEKDPCDGILNLDKKTGKVTAPNQPPLVTELECPKCQSPMNLRDGARGPWLGCSRFPKCRGRLGWKTLEDDVREKLEAELKAHCVAHPIPIIRTLEGKALTDAKGKALPDAEVPQPLGDLLESN